MIGQLVFQRVLFLSALALSAMFFLARLAGAANDIRMEPLPDGVKHWHRIGEDEKKPYFYKLMEDVYHVFVTDADKLPFGKSVAFLVGVGDYEYLSPQLDFVQNDLAALREYLLMRGGFDSVYVAEGDFVDARLVENYMRNKFRRNLDNDDRLLFYYSGHGADDGGTTGYMQFSKAKAGIFDPIQMLAIKNTVEWSRILPAKHALFIFDCCVSGLAFSAKAGHNPYKIRQQMIATLSGSGSRAVITAGTADEEAIGLGDHSVFTKAFLDVLQQPENAQGFLSIDEVFAEMVPQIKYISSKNGRSMTPQRWPLETTKYRGTFLFLDTSKSGRGIPSYFMQEMGGEFIDKGGLNPPYAYGAIRLISYVEGSVLIDGVSRGVVRKGDGVDYDLLVGPHKIEIRGSDGVYGKSFVVEKGRTGRVVIRPAKDVQAKQSFTNDLGMTFVYIPPDTFMMGSPEDEPGRYSNEKQHKVTLTKGFYLQTTEVTQGQWKAVMGGNPSYFKNCGDDCPVEKVSWKDVQAFIEKLNQREGKTYRLPTEAEWEYAARAGTETALYTGPIEILGQNNAPALDLIAWYGGNSGVDYEDGYDSSGWGEKQYPHQRAGTHPVKQKKPNAWELYDMIGNVLEWCADWYGDYPDGPVTDPVGPSSGSFRVIRGGSWTDVARRCRSAYRHDWRPDGRGGYLGFRLARSYP